MSTFFSIENCNAIWLSLQVAFFTSLIALPCAIAVGYFLARKHFFGKVLIEGFINLPMVMPPVTTGFILLLVLGNHGFIGSYLYKWFHIRIAFTFSAAVIASIIVSFPLIVRSVKVAMEMVDVGLENASLSLGASPWQTFFRITLPLASPGIISGFILSFARSLGEFGATITFAGNIAGKTRTMPLAIYSNMQVPGNETKAFGLVLFSVAVSLVAIILSELINKKRNKTLLTHRNQVS